MPNLNPCAKIANLCGLAFRARQVVYGQSLWARMPEVKALVVVSDCGANTKKKLKNKAYYYQIPWIELDVLSFQSITHRPLKAFGILDAGFVAAIEKERIGDEHAK